jgi:hypothetical protein
MIAGDRMIGKASHSQRDTILFLRLPVCLSLAPNESRKVQSQMVMVLAAR